MSIAQRSAQIGITVHGTHRSLVESNAMWDVAAAGIYTEDGNEMFNTLSLLTLWLEHLSQANMIRYNWYNKCFHWITTELSEVTMWSYALGTPSALLHGMCSWTTQLESTCHLAGEEQPLFFLFRFFGKKSTTRWCFQMFFCFHPYLGRWSNNLTNIF